jgi:chemotaxis-related protein WspD
MPEPICQPGEERCWGRIGVWGDLACPRLAEAVHCHNCECFEAAGRSLLERPADPAYLVEWSRSLAEEKGTREAATLSVVVLRLGAEWLALPTGLLQEVTEPQAVRTLPHKSGAVLKGLVNIRGELALCVSLAALLGIPDDPEGRARLSHVVWPRLVVLRRDRDRWAFPADEVYGIQPVGRASLQPVPATVARDQSRFTQGLFAWHGHSVGLLDPDLVLYALERRVF